MNVIYRYRIGYRFYDRAKDETFVISKLLDYESNEQEKWYEVWYSSNMLARVTEKYINDDCNALFGYGESLANRDVEYVLESGDTELKSTQNKIPQYFENIVNSYAVDFSDMIDREATKMEAQIKQTKKYVISRTKLTNIIYNLPPTTTRIDIINAILNEDLIEEENNAN